MSLALGDINAESLQALLAKLNDDEKAIVLAFQAAAIAAEDHLEQVADSIEGKVQNDIAEDVNAVIAGVRDVLTPVNAAIPQVMAMLGEITGRGLVITIALAPKAAA